MTRGKRISNDLREVVYHMSFTFSPEEISIMTKLPPRTVYHIIKEGKAGDDFRAKPRVPRLSYVLSEQDIQFLIMLIQRNPEIYLDELKECLLEEMGKQVSASTIYRTLAKLGFTRKTVWTAGKVYDFLLIFHIDY
ncbi:hypothetical protein M408DRAFT_78900 [Serendipita vermifera MAFF 305830]|uniref:Winged helix-turn helix domain-containing protein n=1 Tax=Serendipita vermifera MAFF 305830 TaxID=933852 RepID=A0A0C2W7Z8_SERVB|nr:hypothetical protein M408DRAFT_78900 [Serendipita vermifera MAFF 305830]